MSTPSFMFTHTLTALKGWPNQAALDFKASPDSDATATINAGSCVSLTALGTFLPGLISDTAMGIFVMQNSTDLDVTNPSGSTGAAFMHQAISPSGAMSGLVATGGYELETTEYVTASAASMIPNTVLTSSSVTNAGKLDVAISGDNICGVVSRGVKANAHGISTLSFWPVYVPAIAAAAADAASSSDAA